MGGFIVVNNILSYRVDSGFKYLEAVELSLNIGWAEAYKKSQNDVSWIKRMALIHPEHYRNLTKYLQQQEACNGFCPIRGKRIFDPYVGRPKCQSQIVWGYECELEQIEISMDHHFPFSLGGPSEASNKIYLCKLHNSLKAADIHFYKWDGDEPIWLKDIIQRISHFF